MIALAAAGVFFIMIAGIASASMISGMVTDSNGARVAGATVTLYINGSQYAGLNNPTTTDVTGTYQFAGLQPGTYSVQADISGYNSNTVMVVLGSFDAQADQMKIQGYSAKAATPTLTPTYSTPTPSPTTKPTPSPSPTMVPLPTTAPSPGFGLWLALLSVGAVFLAWRSRQA